MADTHQYRVVAWWASGRTGTAKSDSGPNAIHFTAPPQFGGVEGRWTPEDLLLSAVASCFTTTFRALAERSRFEYADLDVEVQGTVHRADSGYHFSKIIMLRMESLPVALSPLPSAEWHRTQFVLKILAGSDCACITAGRAKQHKMPTGITRRKRFRISSPNFDRKVPASWSVWLSGTATSSIAASFDCRSTIFRRFRKQIERVRKLCCSRTHPGRRRRNWYPRR